MGKVKKMKFRKKWNGKGYDENGNIIYELKNGCGVVKEFKDNSILIFEGEYLNGKRNGKGKEYNDKGELIFEGSRIFKWKKEWKRKRI